MEELKAIIARIDERTQGMMRELQLMRIENGKQYDQLKKDLHEHIDRTEDNIKSLQDEMKENYVTADSFAPVQRIAFTIVGLFGAGLVAAALKLLLVH